MEMRLSTASIIGSCGQQYLPLHQSPDDVLGKAARKIFCAEKGKSGVIRYK
jgi:hypothetical protein